MFENKDMNILGVYEFDKDKVLVELTIDELSTEIRFNEFYLYEKNIKQIESQSPYLEQFLDKNGLNRISDIYGNMEQAVKPSRLVFFMFFVSEGSLIKTPYGDISVDKIKRLPERLRNIIEFEHVE
ncbi:hypothetical protein KHQ81_13435 [Mycoplasmatota bacterium]|nr:hypothetical protein KHQ81_13435 [Mycoplasmatota bacterium]